MLRINQQLREEIAEVLQRESKDAVLTASLLSITEVETSPDLRSARVYFSVYGDSEQSDTVRQHLDRAAGFVRRSLRKRLDLRTIPDLEFRVDRSMADADRVLRLMHQVESERVEENGEEEPT